MTRKTTTSNDSPHNPAGVPVPSQGRPDLSITLNVEPRKPRLAWQGMERKELAGAVPTQVVEIVRPGRAVERKEELGLGAHAAARAELVRPENRLIWTNDNLVALQTLIDERDPKTKDYRYRGKVDLVYIDPPFMVNNDFRVDNAIDIELDEKAHIQAHKEPSLVEIIAYKDTWRQGLDSFISMLRARLVLLKQLLTPTGSIYVHLDWHAVHYVKVLMDEVFGYENFVNEIIWQRTSSHNDPGRYGVIHDILLFYSNGDDHYWGKPSRPAPADYFSSHDFEHDERGIYRSRDFTAPYHGGVTGRFEWRGVTPPRGRMWAYTKEKMDELFATGSVVFTRNNFPRLKLYIQPDVRQPLQTIWDDILAVNSGAAERLGYPTQKPMALLSRIVQASCPPGGIVLDCFLGSGTTAQAAEQLGRHWIGIDNGKYGIHLARKRLIQLHGQPRPPEKPLYDYVECKHCKSIERKEKPQKSPGQFHVHPFTVENMGVYQRASEWQGFQEHRSVYRDEMIKVFGGEPVEHSPLLHGRKGNSWVHVGPLDAPVSSVQVWTIAREAQHTSTKAVTVLSADFDTLSGSEKTDIQKKTGVNITIRVIPASAIDEVKRRLDLSRTNPDLAIESTAIPAFYAPLSIILDKHVSGRKCAAAKRKEFRHELEPFEKLRERWRWALRDRLSGAGLKPVRAAAVKSRGSERRVKSSNQIEQVCVRKTNANKPSENSSL